METRTNAHMTVYNRTQAGRETRYVRATIENVFWIDSAGANRIKSGSEKADGTTIYIPSDAVWSKPYADPKKFEKDSENFSTLRPGDILVRGIVDDEITTQKELEMKYSEVRLVTTVDRKDFGSAHMQHVKVMAK